MSARPNVAPHNGKETVVIIGAGSTGLCTALNLALDTNPGSRKIAVFETLPNQFEATSGSCTGCLHHDFRGLDHEKLVELGKLSWNLWQKVAEGEKFRIDAGYKPNCFFDMEHGHGIGLGELPDWFRFKSSWNADRDQGPNALVNPKGIGDWLYSECYRLGVDMWFGATVTAVELSPSNEVKSVTYEKDGALMRLECQSLVVAAGPWTPTLYSKLFPASSIKLKSALNAGDWIIFRNPCPKTEKMVAFVALNNVLGKKLEFAGRHDNTIWMTGPVEDDAILPPLGEVAIPTKAKENMLVNYAREYLAQVCTSSGSPPSTLDVVSKGRAIRPATNTILPIISKVDAKDLLNSDVLFENSSGVFVSWGHGSYGLTLGMGTGKVMSELILGRKPSVDMSIFDISRDRAA